MSTDLGKCDETEVSLDSFAQENWIELWDFFKQKPELIKSNPEIRQTVINYENIFFSNLGKSLDEEATLHNLEIFYILHKRRNHVLTQSKFRILVKSMVAILRKSDLHKAYKLAINCPEDDLCQTVITDFERNLPRRISQSQSKVVRVSENPNLNIIDGRRSLFKSAQEKEFFDAVRDVYPQFIVYPNVAMSSVLDFEKVKEFLSGAEKKYFFMAIIDCVVFDYHQLYLPKYFFEVDSLYHDEPTQAKKDEYKNNIFSAAGQKLYRIRRVGNNLGRVDFTKLIRELLKTN